MGKLANLGDIVRDSSGRLGTVINTTTSSLTIKHVNSKERIQYSRLVHDIGRIGYKLVETHEEILKLF